jgi:dihydroflavonol-4-reductase
MAKVLVTGASGFIGTHLVAALAARGDDITCLVRKTSNVGRLQAYGARLTFGDVTELESLSSAVTMKDIVYNVAGRVVALGGREFLDVNRRGVANVLKACARQTTPPVFVQVSSLAAAGPAVDGRARVESDPSQPVSIYGRSKRSGERVAEIFANRVPITIVRPPIVLGEGDTTSFPLFRSVLRFHVHVAPAINKPRFSVIHADDLAQLLILAAQHGKRLPPMAKYDSHHQGSLSGVGRYFAASDEDPTYADLGRLIAKSVGQRVLVIPARKHALRAVALVGEVIGQLGGRPKILNMDKFREIAAGSWLCSAQAAKEQLGYAVSAPLIERLRQTVEWYQRERWL